jgi:ATP-dependent RNA helicase DeaD
VGAIANEADVPGREIGAIDIYDRFSLVEVPARFQRQIIEKMSGATMRGRALEIKIAGADKGERSARGGEERPRRPAPRSYGRPGPRAPWKKRPK